MPTYIGFLRAVNVAPRWVKMARLREVLTAEGFRDVETHIQSGNVRFACPARSARAAAQRLSEAVEAEFGFPVPSLVRTPQELRAVARTAAELPDPLGETTVRRYVTFFAEPVPAARAQVLHAWDAPGERVVVRGGEAYWWLAKSTHQAKLSNAVLERGGLVATTRDLKVVRTLAERWGA